MGWLSSKGKGQLHSCARATPSSQITLGHLLFITALYCSIASTGLAVIKADGFYAEIFPPAPARIVAVIRIGLMLFSRRGQNVNVR